MKRMTLVSAIIMTAALAVPAVASATPATQQHAAKSMAKHSDAAADLHRDMRKLWTDHVVWTRDYIIAAVADQPDATAASNRLMKTRRTSGTPSRSTTARRPGSNSRRC